MSDHDYTRRRWGHDFTSEPADGGKTISGHIWGYGLHEGDYIILANGDRTTRYQFTEIKYYSDPPDMAQYTARFAPRPDPEGATS